MITPEIREQLAALLVVELGPGTPVLPYGVFGPFDPPAVVIGEPDTDFDAWSCTDTATLGLAVVVRHEPAGARDTARALGELWPTVAAAVRRLITADDTLGGLVTSTVLKSATFGDFVVAGQPYPAQLLTLEIHSPTNL